MTWRTLSRERATDFGYIGSMEGTGGLIQHVTSLVESHNARGLYMALTCVDEAGETHLRRWYNTEGRKRVRELADQPRSLGRACELELAFALTSSGAQAVKNARLGRFDGFMGGIGPDFGYALLAAAHRGPEFCGDVVEAASAVKLPSLDWGYERRELFLIFVALIRRYDLPYPSGSGYVSAWASMLALLSTERAGDNWPMTSMILLDENDTFHRLMHADTQAPDFHCLTPRLEELWCSALADPDILSHLAAVDQDWWGSRRDGWYVEDCLHDAVSNGLISRDRVLDAAVDALAFLLPVRAQRVLAKVASALNLSAEDAALRVPQFLAALPIADSTLVGVLLPALLGTRLEPADMDELGSTIIARKEKAHKKTLIAALETWPANSASDQVVTDLLMRLGAMDDRVLAGMADKALVRRCGSDGTRPPEAKKVEEATISVPLCVAPSRYMPEPRQAVEASAAGLAGLASQCSQFDWITRDADCLDVFVRLAASGISDLKHAVEGLAEDSFTGSDVAYGVLGFLRTGSVTLRSRWHQTVWMRFRDELIKETCQQLGKIDELLSTPTWSNGVLSVEDLAQRMARVRSCGRHDLAQALLRLEPTAPDQASLFDGIRCRINGSLSSDASILTRNFISAGGLASRKTRVEGEFLIAEEVPVPDSLLALTRLAGPLAERFTSTPYSRPHGNDEHYLYQWDSHAMVIGVTPHWADAVVVACMDEGADQRADYAQRLVLLLDAPGPFGRATYNYLVQMLHHVRQDSRLIAVEQTMRLIAQGRFDAEQFRVQVNRLAQDGRLTLTRTASSWEQLVMGGAAREVWPALLDVLAWACTVSPKPAGLADLLRMSRVYWPAAASGVPIPEEVRSLALAKGSSKAVAEARALVEVAG